MKITQPFLEVLDFIKKHESFLLLGHKSIDGDCLGSILSFQDFLENIGKKALIYYPDKISEVYSYMDGFNDIKKDFNSVISVDAVIVIDTANKERIAGDNLDILDKIPVLNIDHHISNHEYGDINYVRDLSSSGELIFYLMGELSNALSYKITDVFTRYNELLSAIYDDTGGLRYSNVKLPTIQAVYELVSYGADVAYVSKNLFSSIPQKRVQLLARAYTNLKIEYNGQLAWTFLTNDDFEACRLSPVDTDGIIDIPRNIAGVKLAFFVKEIELGRYKFSFRSDVIDVNKFCRKYGGGGHKRAAGCVIAGAFNNIIDKVLTDIATLL